MLRKSANNIKIDSPQVKLLLWNTLIKDVMFEDSKRKNTLH